MWGWANLLRFEGQRGGLWKYLLGKAGGRRPSTLLAWAINVTSQLCAGTSDLTQRSTCHTCLNASRYLSLRVGRPPFAGHVLQLQPSHRTQPITNSNRTQFKLIMCPSTLDSDQPRNTGSSSHGQEQKAECH